MDVLVATVAVESDPVAIVADAGVDLVWGWSIVADCSQFFASIAVGAVGLVLFGDLFRVVPESFVPESFFCVVPQGMMTAGFDSVDVDTP